MFTGTLQLQVLLYYIKLSLMFYILINGTGNWSTDGCTTEEANDLNSIMCHCNHLTNFALLVVINKSCI